MPAFRHYTRFLKFTAPRRHGLFEFRWLQPDLEAQRAAEIEAGTFDPMLSSDDGHVTHWKVLRRSPVLFVSVQGETLVQAIDFEVSRLKELSFISSVETDEMDFEADVELESAREFDVVASKQFCSVARSCYSLIFRAQPTSNKDMDGRIGAVVAALLEQLLTTIRNLESACKEIDSINQLNQSMARAQIGAGYDPKDTPSVTKPYITQTAHFMAYSVTRSVLNATFENEFVITILPDDARVAAANWLSSYCPVDDTVVPESERREVMSPSNADSGVVAQSTAPHALAAVNKYLGNLASTPAHLKKAEPDAVAKEFEHEEVERIDEGEELLAPDQIPEEAIARLTAAIEQVAASAMPDQDWMEQRRKAIHIMRSALSALPWLADVEVFGSTINGFGAKTSDIDLALKAYPELVVGMTPLQLMESAVKALEQAGVEEIDLRASARVPIAVLTEPITGLRVDLCISNHLAIRNSFMMRAYSNSDPRIRTLAYFLKQLVSARKINNPSESSLSSYGYILMLIAFLQRQNPPAAPCLQAIHPHWRPGLAAPRVTGSHTMFPQVPMPDPTGKLYVSFTPYPDTVAMNGTSRAC